MLTNDGSRIAAFYTNIYNRMLGPLGERFDIVNNDGNASHGMWTSTLMSRSLRRAVLVDENDQPCPPSSWRRHAAAASRRLILA